MKDKSMEITSEELKRLKAFEKSLGYSFKQRLHLKRALTHKSFANERRLSPSAHNERYEYLGDAVLELSVSHLLMDRFPDAPEGELSKLRAAVVNEEQLAAIAQTISLGDYLYLGKGEEQTGGRLKPSLLSDAFEAVLGAIYLDRGFLKTLDVVERHYTGILAMVSGTGFMKDYKTRLQEESQSRFRAIPRYRLIRTTGPDHRKIFEVALAIQGEPMSTGLGPNKKAAEQSAAKAALEKWKTEGKAS